MGFQKGHKFGGNPFAGAREKWRARVNKAVTERQFDNILKGVLILAEQGEEWAVKEIFDRLMGKATQSLELEQRVSIEALWSSNVDEVIDLARKANMLDRLPERLRARALEAPPAVVDVEARVIEEQREE